MITVSGARFTSQLGACTKSTACSRSVAPLRHLFVVLPPQVPFGTRCASRLRRWPSPRAANPDSPAGAAAVALAVSWIAALQFHPPPRPTRPYSPGTRAA